MTLDGIAVPETETPAGRCEYCDRPFPTAERLTLHKGLEHADELDASEQEAFEAARAEEETQLRDFRLNAIGAIIVLYFGLLFLYAIVT